MIHFHAALTHHLLQLTIADWIEAVPANAPENDFRHKVTPFELGFGCHSSRHTEDLSLKGDLSSLPLLVFATQPELEMDYNKMSICKFVSL